MRQAIEKRHLDRAALLARQRLNSRAYSFTFDATRYFAPGVGHRPPIDHLVKTGDDRRRSDSAAQEVDCTVVDDRQEPGAGASTRWIKRRRPPPEDRVRVLHRLFGRSGVTQDAVGEAIGDPTVAIVKR